jgi:hypothetical protein
MVIYIILCSLFTLLATYKRFFSFSNGHDFGLEFGKDFLQPKFLLYSVFSAFFLSLPLNYRVAKKTYRIATGYYAEKQARRSYIRSFAQSPIHTIAFGDPEATAKYLGIPLWLSKSLKGTCRQYIYLVAATVILSTTTLTLVLWKN